MDKYQDLKRHIDQAFAHISKISVSGNSVDIMALARQELRQAYALIPNESTNSDEVEV